MQKWMYAVIAIVAVVAVMGVILGVRYLTPDRPPVENGVPVQNGEPINGAPDNGENGAPDGNGNGIPDVATATSLRFGMEFMEGEIGDVIGDVIWLAKNIGTEAFKSRIEGFFYGGKVGYIVDGAVQRAWQFWDDEWMSLPADDWRDVWDDLANELDIVVRELQKCADVDCTYYDSDEEHWVRIYDITVNPDLDDALFEP